MQKIDSKLAFLLKENRLVEPHTSAIVYKPFELDSTGFVGDE